MQTRNILLTMLTAVLVLVSYSVVAGTKPDPVPNPPLQVREANVDTDGWIAVHEQGEVDVNVIGGQFDGNVTIDSMPPILNGDHPALTSFSQRLGFSVPKFGDENTTITFNTTSHKLCNPGDKMVLTTITGSVSGWEVNFSIYSERVHIYEPVQYFLSGSSHRVMGDSIATRRMVWNDQTNIIFDADPEIKLAINTGDIYDGLWWGTWAIYGYCFTP